MNAPATIEQLHAREAELRSDTNRMLANMIRDNLRADPKRGVQMDREFMKNLHGLLLEVIDVKAEGVGLPMVKGRCITIAGILGELLTQRSKR